MKKYVVVLVLALPLFVTGCNLFSFLSSPPEIDDTLQAMDLRGTWSLILHIETQDNELLSIDLVIRDMSCTQEVCSIGGYLETPTLSKQHRYSLHDSYYYPNQEMVKLTYVYKTIENETREAFIMFDSFPKHNVPEHSMSGHLVVFSLDARPTYLTPEDKQILEASHKGKAVQAGHVTAWLRSPDF